MHSYHNTGQQEKQAENCGEQLQREIVQRWTPLRIRAETLAAAYLRIDEDRRAGLVGDCGTYLQFAETEHGPKLRHANFCRERLCPMCQKRRSLKIFGQASQIMDWVQQRQQVRYVFLTLTVRNCAAEELPATMDALLAGWKRLTYRTCKEWHRSVLGSMRCVEVTRNPVNGTWHPHIHAILAVPPTYFDPHSRAYIRQEEWALLWQRAAGLDYGPIVYVEAVKPRSGRRILAELSGAPDKVSRADRAAMVRQVTEDTSLSEAYREAVANATEYISKDGAACWLGEAPRVDDAGQLLNPHQVLTDAEIDSNVRTLLAGLARRRLIGWTGIMLEARKAMGLDDAEAGDLVHIDQDAVREDVAEVLITYHWRAGCYVRD